MAPKSLPPHLKQIFENASASIEEIKKLPPSYRLRHPNLSLEDAIAIIRSIRVKDRHSIASLILLENPSFPLWELMGGVEMRPLWSQLCDASTVLVERHLQNATQPEYASALFCTYCALVASGLCAQAHQAYATEVVGLLIGCCIDPAPGHIAQAMTILYQPPIDIPAITTGHEPGWTQEERSAIMAIEGALQALEVGYYDSEEPEWDVEDFDFDPDEFKILAERAAAVEPSKTHHMAVLGSNVLHCLGNARCGEFGSREKYEYLRMQALICKNMTRLSHKMRKKFATVLGEIFTMSPAEKRMALSETHLIMRLSRI